MFFRQISDFEENFKFLDRLNVILFNVWKDYNANAFKTQSMDQLEMFYRNYVNEMRQKSEEMSLLLRQIDENVERLNHLKQEMCELEQNPEIEGCWLCTAYGDLGDGEYDGDGSEQFVARYNELDYLEEIAEERTNLYTIESVSSNSAL